MRTWDKDGIEKEGKRRMRQAEIGGGILSKQLTITKNTKLRSGYGAIYPSRLEIADGVTLELEDNSILEIT